MRILIPYHSLELAAEVFYILLLAGKQGFDIDDIGLGLSIKETVDIIDEKVIRLSSNLFPDFESHNDEIDITTLIYGAKISDDTVTRTDYVHIGADVQGRRIDTWQYLGQPVVLAPVQSLTESQSRHHIAWVAASLALGFPLEDALVLSRAAMNVSRETWPTQFSSFPKIEQHSVLVPSTPFRRLSKQSLGLYPVVDSAEWVERLLMLGITTIQLRIKDSTRNDLEKQIAEAIALGKQFKAQVFINDHWQLALKYQAFGVHLGQEDIHQADLELLANSGLALGLSTHGYFELLRIYQHQPSYIALGHIFPTTTKQMPSKPQGLARLGLYQTLLNSMPYGDSSGVPSVAIGGIDLSNIDQVVEQGVDSVAVVRALTEASDVAQAVAELRRKLNQANLNKQEVFDVIG